MEIDIVCNGINYVYRNIGIHDNTIHMNTSITCNEDLTSIIIIIPQVRVNINYLLYMSHIQFQEAIQENMFGHLESKMMISYSDLDFDFVPLHITTYGKEIIQFSVFLPEFIPSNLLREINLYRQLKYTDECIICLEEKNNIISLKNCDHYFCYDCIMKIRNPECPLCRSVL